MSSTIFYSWQSDLPNKTNRGFIEDALEKAITQLKKDVAVYEAERGDGMRLDKDTKNLPGSPAIVQAIFDKISKNNDPPARICYCNNVLYEFAPFPGQGRIKGLLEFDMLRFSLCSQCFSDEVCHRNLVVQAVISKRSVSVT